MERRRAGVRGHGARRTNVLCKRLLKKRYLLPGCQPPARDHLGDCVHLLGSDLRPGVGNQIRGRVRDAIGQGLRSIRKVWKHGFQPR